jgi:hypothetical protein
LHQVLNPISDHWRNSLAAVPAAGKIETTPGGSEGAVKAVNLRAGPIVSLRA